MVTTAPITDTSLPISALADSFAVTLGASGRSRRTIQVYLEALRLFDGFLAGNGMPRTAGAVRREQSP